MYICIYIYIYIYVLYSLTCHRYVRYIAAISLNKHPLRS